VVSFTRVIIQQLYKYLIIVHLFLKKIMEEPTLNAFVNITILNCIYIITEKTINTRVVTHTEYFDFKQRFLETIRAPRMKCDPNTKYKR